MRTITTFRSTDRIYDGGPIIILYYILCYIILYYIVLYYIILYYIIILNHCVTIPYSIQYSNMLYRFVA
jgi:hypothetical protein